jgi:hypothetical protein
MSQQGNLSFAPPLSPPPLFLPLASVAEVVIGSSDHFFASNFALLQSALSPIAHQKACGLWGFSSGPDLRFVPSPQNSIRCLIFRDDDLPARCSILKSAGFQFRTLPRFVSVLEDQGPLKGVEIRFRNGPGEAFFEDAVCEAHEPDAAIEGRIRNVTCVGAVQQGAWVQLRRWVDSKLSASG